MCDQQPPLPLILNQIIFVNKFYQAIVVQNKYPNLRFLVPEMKQVLDCAQNMNHMYASPALLYWSLNRVSALITAHFGGGAEMERK